MKDAIIILCGGGPAPGMNSVSMSVAKTFLSKGYRVIGLHGGYSGLFSKNARTEELDFFKADRYFNRGGSYLEMSRFKPQFFIENLHRKGIHDEDRIKKTGENHCFFQHLLFSLQKVIASDGQKDNEYGIANPIELDASVKAI